LHFRDVKKDNSSISLCKNSWRGLFFLIQIFNYYIRAHQTFIYAYNYTAKKLAHNIPVFNSNAITEVVVTSIYKNFVCFNDRTDSIDLITLRQNYELDVWIGKFVFSAYSQYIIFKSNTCLQKYNFTEMVEMIENYNILY